MIEAPAPRRGWLWWAACAAGWAIMAVAVCGLVTQVDVAAFGRWFAGGLLVHDLVVASLVAVAGALLARWIRGSRVRDALTWSVWVVLLAVLAWWPSLTGAGLHADNPSILPRPYVHNAVIVAVIVAVVAVLRAGVRRRGPMPQDPRR